MGWLIPSNKKPIVGWRQHEERCKNSSYYKGYNLQTQKYSKTMNKRPDFFGVKPNNSRDRIVGDSKYTKRAYKYHVDQIVQYKKYPFCAKTAVIHYARNTEIPRKVKNYANKKNVNLTRTMMEKRKRVFE